MLSEILPHAEKHPGKVFGNGYLITSVEGKGVQWMAMPCKVISETGILHITSSDKLDITSFKKVSRVIFAHKIMKVKDIITCSTTCWSTEIVLLGAI